MIFKARAVAEGAHVRATLFMGEREGSLANVGDLVMRPGEWLVIHDLLGLGARANPSVAEFRTDEATDRLTSALALETT
jgi:hypothetical protein